MDVRELPLEEPMREYVAGKGIETLYPPQAAAVEAGVGRGENVLAAMPTASGKTLVAQIAMVTADGPALYVVPLRALATEKYETFQAVPGQDVGIATGDYESTDEELAAHDIVVATSEKVDAAIRNGADWIESIACAVIDEVHLLDETGRGPTLEMTIAKLRLLCDPQLVALSATVANAAELADWLDAAVVDSDWRPVDLRTGVYDGETITFEDGFERTLPGAPTPTVALVEDALADGGGCLVFVNSRRAAGELAGNLADAVEAAGDGEGVDDLADRIEETATTATGSSLATLARSGIGFHHAGLRPAHRSLVEESFRDRTLDVLCATPTLAAGVNVPARRVVVRDHSRYVDGRFEPLSTLEVMQMFGRAGRPGLDPYGEAYVVATETSAADIADRYLGVEPDAVTSALDDPTAVRPHVLATVASGFGDSREELVDVLASTFCAHQRGTHSLTATADTVLADLETAGMLTVGPEDGLRATDLGALVTRVYVDPGTGADVVDALRRAEELTSVTDLTVCEIVCDTEEMPSRYVHDDEAGRLSNLALRNAERLAKPIADFEGDFHAWLARFKTACLLADCAEGDNVADLVERYGVGPGDVRRIVERAEWLLTATESLAEHVDSSLTDDIRDTKRRLATREL
jgi:helicase